MKPLVGIVFLFVIGALTFVFCSKSATTITTKGPEASDTPPKFSVKVYIENSGSMDGYMCNGSEFKDAIYSYLTALNGYATRMELNYVNSRVVPINAPLGNLIDRLSPAAFSQAGGNRSDSNFKQILTDVINKADDNTVIVFTSDCILDVPQGAASGFLNITRTDINNIVTSKLRNMPTLGFCIYQLESAFDGSYYYPKGGSERYNGRRPYYLWVIGSQENLGYLLKNGINDRIQHGVKNYCAFAPSSDIPNTFSSHGGSEESQKVELKNPHDGKYNVGIKIDLTQTLQGDSYLSDKGNFSISSGKINIEKITKLPSDDKYSYLITAKVNDASFSDFLKIKKPSLPAWVSKDNGTRDDALEAGKTFSIKYIIGGVSDAYSSFPDAGKITITLNKR